MLCDVDVSEGLTEAGSEAYVVEAGVNEAGSEADVIGADAIEVDVVEADVVEVDVVEVDVVEVDVVEVDVVEVDVVELDVVEVDIVELDVVDSVNDMLAIVVDDMCEKLGSAGVAAGDSEDGVEVAAVESVGTLTPLTDVARVKAVGGSHTPTALEISTPSRSSIRALS